MTERKFFALVFGLLFLFMALVSFGCGGGGGPLSLNNDDDNDDIIHGSNYVVKFDSQGGTYIEEQTVEPGKTASVPEEPEKDNNAFMGWYTAQGFSFRFDFDTPISRDITLYAKWWSTTDTTDSDGDGLIDSLELTYGTDPNKPDTDGDNLSDYDELYYLGYNPLVKDTDGNGIEDGDEDADQDGLTNLEEAAVYSTNMIIADTDHDGLSDYEEVNTYKTDPLKADTDEDGVDDGTEIAIGSDPLTAETSFTTTLGSDMTSENPKAIDISVSMNSSARAAGSLQVMPADYYDNPLINPGIPGYMAAYNISADGEFDSAAITFTLGSEVGQDYDDDEFSPAVYYFNEVSGVLEKVANQRIDGNKIIAEVSHFSIYVLINQVEYNKVWSVEIRLPSSNNTDDFSINIAFVIDYSQSMEENDGDYLFKTLSKNFVDALRDGQDKAAVVKFIATATTVSYLTSDKEQIKSAIDSITYDSGYNYDSGTNGSAGLYSALDILASSQSGYKYIVFLTDGEDNRSSYSYDYITQLARADNVIIYSIGMGSAKEDVLKQISSETGGAYYKATTNLEANNIIKLDEVYKEIQQETLDMATDSNNDGISDYYTKLLNDGILPISTGESILTACTDMFGVDNADWDGDGLKNGEEITIVSVDLGDRVRVTAYMNSNPLLLDTDFDGYSDSEEVNTMHTSPMRYTIITKDDANQLLDNNNFPREYINSSMPDDNTLDTLTMYAFGGDVSAKAKKTLIDYFHKYAVSVDTLSKDAQAEEKVQYYEKMHDGIALISDVIKAGKSFVELGNNIGSDTYTQSENEKKLLNESLEATTRDLNKMIEAKKADIAAMNDVAFADLFSEKKSEHETLVLLRSKKSASKSLISEFSSLSGILDNFTKSENGLQTFDAGIKLLNTALDLSKTVLNAGTKYNVFEFPCRWSWLSNMSGINKNLSGKLNGKAGKLIGGTVTVALTALELQENYYELAAVYGQIAANCKEYQKYLDVMEKIANNKQFSPYVQDAAKTVTEMFDDSGNPAWKDWEEFEAKLKEAYINSGSIQMTAFKSIVNWGISAVEKTFPVLMIPDVLYKIFMSHGGVTEGYNMLVDTQVYYAITWASAVLFEETVDVVNGWIEPKTESDLASKYVLQLAQSRIVGIDRVKEYLLNGKFMSWLINLVVNKTEEEIEAEYNGAIKKIYDIAKKCRLELSDKLPLYDTYGK